MPDYSTRDNPERHDILMTEGEMPKSTDKRLWALQEKGFSPSKVTMIDRYTAKFGPAVSQEGAGEATPYRGSGSGPCSASQDEGAD